MKTLMAVVALSALTGGIARAHDDDAPAGAPGEKLGTVHFAVECNVQAQREFDHAVALYHSFWFDPASKAFGQVLEHDAGCGMAYWGIALSALANPFGWPPPPKAMQTGAAAIEQGLKVGARSQRERDYIAALAKLFENWDKTDHRPRALAWEQAMQVVAQRYPDDPEAGVFYALSLIANAQASDKTFANQLKAAAILEPFFETHPDHPGAAHYLIHTYDYTELVERGLPAARRYASIAPSAPHALHMPAHIFTRLGLWDDSIATNRASAQAARSELKDPTPGLGSYNALHAMDYMMYAHLQQGQDGAARSLLDEVNAIEKLDLANFAAAYALAAMPARYALEHHDWAAAATLTPKPQSLPWNQYPQAEAVIVYTRAMGLARLGQADAALVEIARLQALREAMAKAKLGYWAQQAEIQAAAAGAWVSLARGQSSEALAQMHRAVRLEGNTDKHPVTPGPLIPAGELLAEMLLELGRPADALAEFERVQRTEPNRLLPIYGAARAAELAGQPDVARANYEALLVLTQHADSERREMAQAKAYLARK
jgi:hypothetical protein